VKIRTVANRTTAEMKPRNQGPIADCVKLWIDWITPLRVRNVPKSDRPNVNATSTTFQTRRMFFFSWIITECRNAVAASQGISAAFSTESQP
jgi:hypothetical protein